MKNLKIRVIKLVFICNIFGELIVSVVVCILSFIMGSLWESRKYIGLRLKLIKKYNMDIRVSLSYLYSIKSSNKFLLIKGNRIDQYQPVGGVYKYYESFIETQKKLNVRAESSKNFYEKEDLRVIVRGKNLFSLIKWFETGKNRETSVFREFYEELISSHILKPEDLENVKFEFLKREKTSLKYSKHFQMNELLIYDIIDVHLTEEVESKILDFTNQNDKLLWVSFDEIKRECVDKKDLSTKIGAHTKFLL